MVSNVIVFCLSLSVSLALVFSVRWHGRFSLDSTVGVQKFHTQPTPRVGGIAIFVGLIGGWIFASPGENTLFQPMLVASLPAFLVGLLEDVTKRIGVLMRLLATMSSGVIACSITGIALDRVDVPIIDVLLEYWPFAMVFTAVAVAGIANAINIIDGFNGLSSGSVIIVLSAFGAIANHHGDFLLVACCLLLGAAVLGFWVVNFPLGRLFLGDGGAYLLGFSVSWIAVLLVARNASLSPWLVLLACAYPVIEVLYSVVRRILDNRPASEPDSAHLHSILKRKLIAPRLAAWPAPLRNSAVSPLIWLYAAVPAIAAVLLVRAPVWLVIVALVLCVFLYHLFYSVLKRLDSSDGNPPNNHRNQK